MDLLPKVSDIKNLKDLCKVIVLPLLCACYIIQSQFSLDFGDYVFSLNGAEADKVLFFKVVIIIVGKTIFSSFMSFVLYFIFAFLHVITKGAAMLGCILILLTFGFLGVFAGDKVVSIIKIEAIWYYASFVTAFFLLAMLEQLSE